MAREPAIPPCVRKVSSTHLAASEAYEMAIINARTSQQRIVVPDRYVLQIGISMVAKHASLRHIALAACVAGGVYAAPRVYINPQRA